MHSTPTFDTAAARPQAAKAASRLVVDAPTRMFHWLFALSFLGAYLTAEGERWRALHVSLGLVMAGLLVFRVLYGLFGPRHAGLGPLLRKLGNTGAWLRSLMQGVRAGSLRGIDGRQSQNRLMALAIVGLLVLAVPLTLSGYGVYAEWGGAFGEDWLGEVHELFSNLFLALVLGHLALISGLSLLRRKNQAQPMLTGRVDGAGPDLVKRNHAWLAGLLLAAVMAFMAWEWQQSPNGLVPLRGATGWSVGADHDD